MREYVVCMREYVVCIAVKISSCFRHAYTGSNGLYFAVCFHIIVNQNSFWVYLLCPGPHP